MRSFSGFCGKESACSVGDPGSILESERCSGEGNGNPFQYSRLENPIDRGAWWATVHGDAKSLTRKSKSHSQAHPLPLGRIRLYVPPRRYLLNQHVVTGPTELHNRWHKAIKAWNRWNSNIYSTNHMRLICCCSL